jgi:hypothetical protein
MNIIQKTEDGSICIKIGVAAVAPLGRPSPFRSTVTSTMTCAMQPPPDRGIPRELAPQVRDIDVPVGPRPGLRNPARLGAGLRLEGLSLRRPPPTVAAPIRSMTSRLDTCRGSAGGEVSVGPRPS